MDSQWAIVVGAGVGAAPALITFIVQHRFERLRYMDEQKRLEREEGRANAEADRAHVAARYEARLTSYFRLIDALSALDDLDDHGAKVAKLAEAQRAAAGVLVYGSDAVRELLRKPQFNSLMMAVAEDLQEGEAATLKNILLAPLIELIDQELSAR